MLCSVRSDGLQPNSVLAPFVAMPFATFVASKVGGQCKLADLYFSDTLEGALRLEVGIGSEVKEYLAFK